MLFQQMRRSLDTQPVGEAWTDAEGTWSVLILSVPAVGLELLTQDAIEDSMEPEPTPERILVGVVWRGERRERRADEQLLRAFGSACALVMSAARPCECSPRD